VDILPILYPNVCILPTWFLVYLMHHSIFYSISSELLIITNSSLHRQGERHRRRHRQASIYTCVNTSPHL